MQKMRKLHTLYNFVNAYANNPRISISELHREYSPYRSENATTSLLRIAREKRIIWGPFLYVNHGLSIEIIEHHENPLNLLEEKRDDESIMRAFALCGDFSFISFSLNNDNNHETLTYAETIVPSFPGNSEIELFDEFGKLKNDNLPDWEDLDWEVYYAMRDPTNSFLKVGKKLDISWMTVKRHLEKILVDCKSMVAFFPLEYERYDQIVMTFKTKNEIGLRNELKRLDRSSYLWKFDGTILLFLFVRRYNKTCAKFKEMEEKGIIKDLTISIPIRNFICI